MTATWGPTNREGLTAIAGGVTAAAGIRASAVTAGLKASHKPDVALVVGDALCGVAVTTTTNLVKAAPCVVTERHAANGRARAVIINSGNANACTGAKGLADAERTAQEVAIRIGCRAADVLVMSTGVIGVPLPLQRLVDAIEPAVRTLSPEGGNAAAKAIMTTDTVVKQVAYRVEDEHGACVIGGMAKGAGMIEPAMATMLCVITTDAPLAAAVLGPMVRQAVTRTFNRISVDGCGSTNDTVAVLATGHAPAPPGLASFQRGLEAVCADLARMIVSDGESISRTAAITVSGAPDEETAVALARSVASSVLFRTALAGGDPNWGRILAAMGASGVLFDPERVTVACGGITVCRFGTVASFDRGQASIAMSRKHVEIDIEVGLGREQATLLTCDLTTGYVAFNSEYTT